MGHAPLDLQAEQAETDIMRTVALFPTIFSTNPVCDTSSIIKYSPLKFFLDFMIKNNQSYGVPDDTGNTFPLKKCCPFNAKSVIKEAICSGVFDALFPGKAE